MATRSTIALEYADGSVHQIYCHWDGYIEHNGRILNEHYSDPFVLREMMDLGDVSSLGSMIGKEHPFSRLDTTMSQEEFDTLYGDMTTFYGRDRGESHVEARKFQSFDDYTKNGQFEEFNYILRTDGQWYVSSSDDFVKLENELLKETV